MDRKNLHMARIEDDSERQATFQRRKNGLMRRAMELSVLCGVDVAMFMFAPNNKLSQFTSGSMEALLNRYSRTCQELHETRTNRDFLQMLPSDLAADVMALHPSRHTHQVKPLVMEEGEGDVSSMSDDSALQQKQLDILKPLGLAPEDVKLPLSPRSEDAYARINEEFDLLYSQLQEPGEQAGQNHAERSPASNDSMAGAAAGKGKRGGKQAAPKKKGNAKGRKKEAPAAAAKKAAVKAASKRGGSTPPPQEEVGEGGLPREDVHRTAPATSSAGRATPAAPDAPTSSAAAATPRGDKNAATSASRQAPASQPDVTSPTASSTVPPQPQSKTTQQEAPQQNGASGMPLGAVDMTRAGAAAPTLAQGSADPAAASAGTAGVTFAPHQLASYPTPNFYMGEAAAALRDAGSARPSQASHLMPGMAASQALHASHPQGSSNAAAKSSSSHPPLHAEPSFSHGGAFPGKRKRPEEPDTTVQMQNMPNSFARSVPPAQIAAAVSTSAAAQLLTAGMPVQ